MRAPLLVACALLLAVHARASADTPDAVPFTPPAGWQALPSAIIPVPLLNWLNGTSSFGVNGVAIPVKLTQMAPMLKAQAGNMGTLESSTSNAVCGQPALQFVVKVDGTGQILSEQIQSLGGTMYVSAYARSGGTQADPAIRAFMAKFCGSKSLANLTPPSGWKSIDARLLGIWLSRTSPTNMMMAFSRKSQADSESMVNEMVRSTIKSPTVNVVSRRTGTLCGNPASFITVRATPSKLPETELQAVVTQSPSVAYLLMYSHPAASAADPAAVAALSTLCASPNATAPQATAPSAGTSTSPTPAPSMRSTPATTQGSYSSPAPSVSPAAATPTARPSP